MRRKLLWLGGILVGLILLATVIGASLPRDHESTREIVLREPIERVWALLIDRERAPQWRTGVDRVEIVDADRHVEHGEWGPMPMRVELREPPNRLVSRIDDPDLGYGGTWTFELAQVAGGTRVRITERGFVSNPLMRLMSAAFMDPAQSQTVYLEDLGRYFEQDVRPLPPD